MIILWVLLLLLYVTNGLIISLNDQRWTVSNANRSIVLNQVGVPNSIYWQLFQKKVIGDPYYRFNDVETKWVCYENWTFRVK